MSTIGPADLTSLDDNQLVMRAQRGDRAACDQLLRRHYDRLYAVCRRVAGNDADAADGCQEALVAIVKGLGRFDGRASFKTWSYRVATNACLDELRRRGRRPLPNDDVQTLIGSGHGHDRQPVDALGDAVVERDEIDTALGQLPEEYRQPIVLRDMVGMDYAQIAQTLNIPPGTVRSRIARGRRQLSELLGNQAAHDQRPRSDL